MRLTFGQAFFRTGPDRTGACSGTGRYGTKMTGEAWHIMLRLCKIARGAGAGKKPPRGLIPTTPQVKHMYLFSLYALLPSFCSKSTIFVPI